MTNVEEGDIVLLTTNKSERIGKVFEIDDGLMRIGGEWYDMSESQIKILHSDS